MAYGLVIHRRSVRSFGVGAVLACGMPNPIDHDRFPTRSEAGYPEVDQVLSGTTAASGVASMTGCPEDITLIFQRPMQQGGCQGAGCHSPGNTSPDLVSPNPEERLLDVPSQCDGRPYISVDDSFLVDKLIGSPPECGSPMPFGMPEALSAQDEACILAWIDEVRVP